MNGQLEMNGTRRLNRHYQNSDNYNMHFEFTEWEYSRGSDFFNEFHWGVLTSVVFPFPSDLLQLELLTAGRIKYELPDNVYLFGYSGMSSGQGFWISVKSARGSETTLFNLDSFTGKISVLTNDQYKYIPLPVADTEKPLKPDSNPETIIVEGQTAGHQNTGFINPQKYKGKNTMVFPCYFRGLGYTFYNLIYSTIYVRIKEGDVYREPTASEGETIRNNTKLIVDLKGVLYE